MNLPSEYILAGHLEEINPRNRTIFIFRALIFLLHGRCQASELFVAIFGGVEVMKKGGKKYIIYEYRIPILIRIST